LQIEGGLRNRGGGAEREGEGDQSAFHRVSFPFMVDGFVVRTCRLDPAAFDGANTDSSF
jgi:hypothetical protein